MRYEDRRVPGLIHVPTRARRRNRLALLLSLVVLAAAYFAAPPADWSPRAWWTAFAGDSPAQADRSAQAPAAAAP